MRDCGRRRPRSRRNDPSYLRVSFRLDGYWYDPNVNPDLVVTPGDQFRGIPEADLRIVAPSQVFQRVQYGFVEIVPIWRSRVWVALHRFRLPDLVAWSWKQCYPIHSYWTLERHPCASRCEGRADLCLALDCRVRSARTLWPDRRGSVDGGMFAAIGGSHPRHPGRKARHVEVHASSPITLSTAAHFSAGVARRAASITAYSPYRSSSVTRAS